MDPDADKFAAVRRALLVARYTNGDNIPCQIEEGLFLGSAAAGLNMVELKKLNITHILTMAASLPPAYPDEFTYKVVRVVDTEDTNLAQYFDECFDFIDEAKRMGGGVLVHCFVGRSRSVTIVVAYLMKKHGMTLIEAHQHVRSKRPKAAPNSGFMKQLVEFEKSLSGVSMDVLPEEFPRKPAKQQAAYISSLVLGFLHDINLMLPLPQPGVQGGDRKLRAA
ncbi:hypothetical protein V2J09_017912 [Rumex salicifolius]